MIAVDRLLRDLVREVGAFCEPSRVARDIKDFENSAWMILRYDVVKG